MIDFEERVAALVDKYDMLPHPEGGWYKETYRSENVSEYVHGKRNFATSILFLLTQNNSSKFHSIQSDELWFFHEGNPFTVHTLSENGYETLQLGNTDGGSYQAWVKAKVIFGSTVEKGYSFVSCVVAPGFDFDDFKLYSKEELLPLFPENEAIISRLT